MTGLRLGLLGLLIGIVTLTLLVGSSAAAGFQVTTTADTVAVDGDCSLREAIQAANTDAAVNECVAGSGADTITFAVSGTITLASPLPDVTDPAGLKIDGSGQSITISGDNTSRVLRVVAAGLTLAHVTVANGFAGFGPSGGGVLNQGTLTVTNSTFSGNAGRDGGGINNADGTLTVTDSTFSGNSTYGFPAGPTPLGGDGGGIRNTGTLTVTNSTFSGNSAGGP